MHKVEELTNSFNSFTALEQQRMLWIAVGKSKFAFGRKSSFCQGAFPATASADIWWEQFKGVQRSVIVLSRNPAGIWQRQCTINMNSIKIEDFSKLVQGLLASRRANSENGSPSSGEADNHEEFEAVGRDTVEGLGRTEHEMQMEEEEQEKLEGDGAEDLEDVAELEEVDVAELEKLDVADMEDLDRIEADAVAATGEGAVTPTATNKLRKRYMSGSSDFGDKALAQLQDSSTGPTDDAMFPVLGFGFCLFLFILVMMRRTTKALRTD